MSKRLVLLGVGQTALAVAAAARSHGYAEIFGTTRSVERLPELEDAGISPLLIEVVQQHKLHDQIDQIALSIRDADVLVSFPPEHESDMQLAVLSNRAHSTVYISSTGVYGKLQGVIDESSPVDSSSPQAAARLKSEEIWRQKGAIILRVAGLYNKHSGLHKRLAAGSYRIPGDGSNYVSRIHLDDLATIILAAFERNGTRNHATNTSTYVVADARPATHMEVVLWLCQKLQIAVPETVPLSEVHETLRGNRQICSNKILHDLDIKLAYPSFVEGYSQALG